MISFALGFPSRLQEPEITLRFQVADTESNAVIRWGVPLRRAWVQDWTELALLDSKGGIVPCQFQVVSRHGDHSAHWVQLQFELRDTIYHLRRQGGIERKWPDYFRSSSTEGELRIQNPVFQLRCGTNGEHPIQLEDSQSTRLATMGWQTLGPLWPVRRSMHSLEPSAFRSGFVLEEDQALGPTAFLAKTQAEILGPSSRLQVRLRWTQMSQKPLDGDLAFVLDFRERFQRVYEHRGRETLVHPWNGQKSLLWQSSEHSSSQADGLTLALQGTTNWVLRLPQFARWHPKKIEIDDKGKVTIYVLPKSETILPGSSVGLDFHLTRLDSRQSPAQFSCARWVNDPIPELSAKVYRAALMDSDRGSRELPRSLKQKLQEIEKEFLQEFVKTKSWRDRGDYKMDLQSWGNLEYDTLQGLLRRFFQNGEQQVLDLAEDAAGHWQNIDLVRISHRGRSHLPAVHAKNHTDGQKLDAAHVWLRGALNLYALRGNQDLKADLLRCGDSLKSLITEAKPRKKKEKFDAWPLQNFVALHSFFPDHGFQVAREQCLAEILRHYVSGKGYFDYEPVEGDSFRVNTWQLGGLMLETLDSYRDWEDSPTLQGMVEEIVHFLIQEAWDPSRRKFWHTLIVNPERDETLEQSGSLRPFWSLYLFSGIARAAQRDHNPVWKNFVEKNIGSIAELSWPKQHFGNAISLAWRTVFAW